MAKKKRHNPYNVEMEMEKYSLSREEAIAKIADMKARRSCSLEGYIRRHGEEIGKQKYDEHRQKLSDSNQYNVEWVMKRYSLSRVEAVAKVDDFKARTSTSLEGFIRRHGEEIGRKKYDEYRQNIDSSSLSAYIRRHGEELGRKKWVAKGGILPEDVPHWELYQKLAYKYNDFIQLNSLREKLQQEKGEKMSRDHILSVRTGFKNNIPIHLISHHSNLQILTMGANAGKGGRNKPSDLVEFYERIFGS